jgi:nicotinamidase-related amidase
VAWATSRCSSRHTGPHRSKGAFANTDLDLQLEKHGIHQLIVIGLIAHTCIEATFAFAAELGYEVTVVKDDGGLLGRDDAPSTWRVLTLGSIRKTVSISR